MMPTYPMRVQQTAFKNWLSEHIYYEGMEHAPRTTVLFTFIQDLRQYISSKGYAFRTDEVSMAKNWARFLFLTQTQVGFKGHFAKNPLGRPEDYTMYCDLFDSESRQGFEEMLCKIQDFDTSTYKGCRALASVFPFAWYHIDINNSSTTEIVDDMLESSESEEEPERSRVRKQTDPYLVDQANAASKYNRWD